MRKSPLTDAWLIIVLGVAFGAALAGVQATLSPRIAANRLQDTLAQIPALIDGAARGERAGEFDPMIVYRALDAENRPVGWVVLGTGQGFADRIELLVGLDPSAERIRGVYVLQQNETPGLGNRVTESSFLGRFRDQPAATALRVVKGAASAAGEVEAVTGATVSSESVVRIVNETVGRFRDRLARNSAPPEVRP